MEQKMGCTNVENGVAKALIWSRITAVFTQPHQPKIPKKELFLGLIDQQEKLFLQCFILI
ncbi:MULTISPECIES: hypothetical protein [unclassified Paenibacillus]|uniref:hypothetical protein n=1 Tax=unclassified Paenibacillus TaxID=185978 RepID=UPI0012E3D8A4|nr:MULTISPECIES: hypothetical protein [unclassified Paenibacillus]